MEVKWYSGCKGEEKPSKIIIDGKEYEIKRVLSEEQVEDSLTGMRKRVFVVQTDAGVYKLQYDGNEWELKRSSR